jgi:glutaredoxin-related protein
MAGNPFVRKARKRLDAAGVAHHDLDYGSYLGDWRRRNALKLWTGWPTFPMVFVKGTLVGGADDLVRLIESGELARLLA